MRKTRSRPWLAALDASVFLGARSVLFSLHSSPFPSSLFFFPLSPSYFFPQFLRLPPPPAMLVPAFLPALLLSASVASAAHSSAGRRGHKDRSASLRRAGTAALERALNDKQTTVRRRSDKRCKVRATADSLVAGSTSASSSAAAAAPTLSSSSSDTWVAPTSTSSSEEAWVAPTTSSVAVNLAVQPTSTQQAWVEATTSSTSEWVA